MPRRTTVLLDEDIYEWLIRESIRRYGTSRALSKVLNEVLRRGLSSKNDLIKLIYSEKLVNVEQAELEDFRRKLSRRFEER